MIKIIDKKRDSSILRVLLLALVSGPALASCGGQEAVGVSAKEDSLYYLSTQLWPTNNVNVCWASGGTATERTWVQQALKGQRSWEQAGKINLLGWGNCPAGFQGIRLIGGSSMVTEVLGRDPADSVTDITLDFTASPQTKYSRCINNSLDREQCIKTVALHEFGHALGSTHEQNRDDTPASCTQAPQGPDGDTTFGEWDDRSIMNYCNSPRDLSGLDRRGFDRIYGARNGDVPRLADVNADGRDDLLCHDTVAGTKWVDYASATGDFGGTDWERASTWCNHHSGRLFRGDFNGDGRSDLLCHDVATARKWIDFADTSGRYLGTDWESSSDMCADSRGRLLVQDLNGDGRDDLLCLNPVITQMTIQLASSSGTFANTAAPSLSAFCPSGDRSFTGDFNGDGIGDVLCHGPASGRKEIQFGTAATPLGGSSWSTSEAWCSHDTGELMIGDFNGDGRDDLFCNDLGDGHKWIDYADTSGRFLGTDWERTTTWCAQSDQRIFTGDFNGDGRDDWLCHDVQDGRKWIDFASSTGTFTGTNWSSTANWCGLDAAELH